MTPPKLLTITGKELLAFGLPVQVSGRQLVEIIIVFSTWNRFSMAVTASIAAMTLAIRPCTSSVAGGWPGVLSITTVWMKSRMIGMLSRGVVLIAGVMQQDIHDNLDALRTELLLQAGEAFDNIAFRDIDLNPFGCKPGAAHLDLVEFIVEGRELRSALVGPV